MKSWKRRREDRCPGCSLSEEWCYCDKVRKLSSITPVTVIMHINEHYLPSSTVRLASRCLDNLEVVLRGEKGRQVDDLLHLRDDCQPCYLFPSEDSRELNSALVEEYGGKIQLIVPDGTWRQVKNIKQRVKTCRDIPSVAIPETKPSIYSLRTQNEDKGLCTLEAIARALQIIEGGTIQNDLEAILSVMVQRFQASRGNFCEA